MTDVAQFISEARSRCRNAIRNTAVGRWLERSLALLEAGPPSALDLLTPHKSWVLHRVSPTTATCDLVVHVRATMTAAEIDTITRLVRSGSCYRCRIGRGRYHYAATAIEAAQAAVRTVKRKKDAPDLCTDFVPERVVKHRKRSCRPVVSYLRNPRNVRQK